MIPSFTIGKAIYGLDLVMKHRRKSPVPKELQKQMITPEILEKVKYLNRPNTRIYEYVVGAGRQLCGQPPADNVVATSRCSMLGLKVNKPVYSPVADVWLMVYPAHFNRD